MTSTTLCMIAMLNLSTPLIPALMRGGVDVCERNEATILVREYQTRPVLSSERLAYALCKDPTKAADG